jgi:hypothetical protein
VRDRYEALFRQFTPLVVLGIAVVALVGPWLPGADWVAQHFGDTFVLGFCVFLLGLYVLLLWGESLRLHAMLSAVLRELLEFKKGRAAEVQARPQAHKIEAVRLLLPALASPDPKIRATSRRNLALLVGQDLGDDVAAWQGWLDRQQPDEGT